MKWRRPAVSASCSMCSTLPSPAGRGQASPRTLRAADSMRAAIRAELPRADSYRRRLGAFWGRIVAEDSHCAVDAAIRVSVLSLQHGGGDAPGSPWITCRSTSRTRTDAAAGASRRLRSSVLYLIQVSITSCVKTSPRSRNSWSFARASSASSSEPGVFGTFGQLFRRADRRCPCRAARRDGSCSGCRRCTAISMRGEGEVRIAARVGAAELDPLRLRAGAVHRNAAGGRAIALRVGQVHRRFVARHQPLVAVGRRVA